MSNYKDITDYGGGTSVSNNGPAIEAMATDRGTVVIPPGDYQVLSTIYTGGKPIRIIGAGRDVTRLIAGANIDMFHHQWETTVDTVPYFGPFELRDLSIVAGVPAGIAVVVRQNNGTGGLVMDKVAFGSFSEQFNWRQFFLGHGNSRALFRDVEASGGSYGNYLSSATQVGFGFDSESDREKIFDITFENCNIDAVVHAIYLHTSGLGSIEGLKLLNTNGRTVRGPYLRHQVDSAAFWTPPFVTLNTCNMEGPGTLIQLDSVSEFFMTNCTHYVQALPPNVGRADFVNLGRAINVWIENNRVKLYNGARVSAIVSTQSGSLNLTHRDNIYTTEGDANSTNGISFAAFVSNSQNTRSSNNIYEMDASINREAIFA